MRIRDWSSDVCSSDLDDIAWLLNLRGNDVPCNPVFLAHVLVGQQNVRLFVGAGTVGPDLQTALALDGIELRDYGQIGAALADRTSVVEGKSVSVRVALGGRRIIKK